MKILVIDRTLENQADIANRIQALPAEEIDSLLIQFKLSNENEFHEHIASSDLVIFGPELGLQAFSLARMILSAAPQMPILCIANSGNFSATAVRNAQSVGIRKLLSENCSDIELLQELITSFASMKSSGRALGKIIVFASPKGGAGSTTLVAGLGEYCATQKRKTLLWDLDIDTRDLSRALNSPLSAGLRVSEFQACDRISNGDFNSLLFQLHEYVDLLSAPADLVSAGQLLYSESSLKFLERACEVARYNYDNILIDLGSSPGVGSQLLLNLADEVVLLTGECSLSITACEQYAQKLTRTCCTPAQIKILLAGSNMAPQKVRQELQQVLRLPHSAWILPPLPNDSEGSNWPGSGRTFFSMASPGTRATIARIASELSIASLKLLAYSPEASGPGHMTGRDTNSGKSMIPVRQRLSQKFSSLVMAK